MSTSYDQQHVEYPSRKRMALLTVGAALFVAAGFFLMFDDSSTMGSAISSVIGLFSILFFGLCLCYSLVKMIKKEPSFVVDEHGFVDSSSYTSGGIIAWKDVESIFMYEFMGQKMIGVKLWDENAFLDRQNGMKRKLMLVNSSMVDATVSIAQNSLTLPLDQLYTMMVERWKRSNEGANEGNSFDLLNNE
ncbi:MULTISPECIES: STM3941 family protein [unclassified Paenibacillus]|uniref:STM3941 family protein n=1 Tax=unclassified Paenibacillus TaxID=185978 RepID=UPI0004218DDA|nr:MULTISPECIES: STM3941 family protein [unclassified Paenibacillus]